MKGNEVIHLKANSSEVLELLVWKITLRIECVMVEFIRDGDKSMSLHVTFRGARFRSPNVIRSR